MSQKDLFLVRHGETERYDSQLSPGGDRALSAAGTAKIVTLGQQLKGRGLRPEIILHSPLLRTAQTAGILGRILETTLQAQDVLAEDAAADQWGAALASIYQSRSSAMIVGHEPGLIAFLAESIATASHSIAVTRGIWIHLRLSEWTTRVAGHVTEIISPRG